MLRPYRACNPMVGFSKYEFNNKLLDDKTFFRVMLGVTRILSYISLFYMNFDKSTVRLHYLHIVFMFVKFEGDQILIVMSSIICLN